MRSIFKLCSSPNPPLIGLNGHFMKPWAMPDLDIDCYRSLAPSHHRYQTYQQTISSFRQPLTNNRDINGKIDVLNQTPAVEPCQSYKRKKRKDLQWMTMKSSVFSGTTSKRMPLPPLPSLEETQSLLMSPWLDQTFAKMLHWNTNCRKSPIVGIFQKWDWILHWHWTSDNGGKGMGRQRCCKTFAIMSREEPISGGRNNNDDNDGEHRNQD